MRKTSTAPAQHACSERSDMPYQSSVFASSAAPVPTAASRREITAGKQQAHRFLLSPAPLVDALGQGNGARQNHHLVWFGIILRFVIFLRDGSLKNSKIIFHTRSSTPRSERGTSIHPKTCSEQKQLHPKRSPRIPPPTPLTACNSSAQHANHSHTVSLPRISRAESCRTGPEPRSTLPAAMRDGQLGGAN